MPVYAQTQTPPTREEIQTCANLSAPLRREAQENWQRVLRLITQLAKGDEPQALPYFLQYQAVLDRYAIDAVSLPCAPALQPLQQQLATTYEQHKAK